MRVKCLVLHCHFHLKNCVSLQQVMVQQRDDSNAEGGQGDEFGRTHSRTDLTWLIMSQCPIPTSGRQWKCQEPLGGKRGLVSGISESLRQGNNCADTAGAVGISKGDIVMPEASVGPFLVLLPQLAGFLCSASFQLTLPRSSLLFTMKFQDLFPSSHAKIGLPECEQTSQDLDPRIHVYRITSFFFFCKSQIFWCDSFLCSVFLKLSFLLFKNGISLQILMRFLLFGEQEGTPVVRGIHNAFCVQKIPKRP